MHRARLFLMLALCLILTSCASLGKAEIVFVPPKVDCAAYDAPQVDAPVPPMANDRQIAVWQLHAWKWQAYAEHVLTQRVETAGCLQRLKQQGVIK
ncbi:MAG: hypothetical protein GX856_08720 [Gammaproteobacteria bacterium]|jgi:hypothetical protein|nr:hypothetical protein [Gammaproteobacteria bacterium]